MTIFRSGNILSIIVVLIIAGALIVGLGLSSGKLQLPLKPANDRTQVTNKPRLVELYTNWTGCAQGHARCMAYNNIVGQCATTYANQIDFQILNMDNEHDRMIGHKLAGDGTMLALPTIYLFNSSGARIAEFKDNLTFAEMDKHLRDPELYK